VDYATSNKALSPKIVAQVDELKQQIIDGEIKVPTEL
jgi:basic membrane lipoprotein Med (substrate-binding protein (PBP1-ABC) superfamily)